MEENLWRVYKDEDCLGTFVVDIESKKLTLGSKSFRLLQDFHRFVILESVFTTRTVVIDIQKTDSTSDYTYIFTILGDHTGGGWERELR